jgi:hypothetical protein
MKDDHPRNGLMCFKDQNRECGAACMAFLTYPPADKDFVGQQWAHCMELVALHRSSKHMVIIAGTLTKVQQRLDNESADRQRLSALPGKG